MAMALPHLPITETHNRKSVGNYPLEVSISIRGQRWEDDNSDRVTCPALLKLPTLTESGRYCAAVPLLVEVLGALQVPILCSSDSPQAIGIPSPSNNFKQPTSQAKPPIAARPFHLPPSSRLLLIGIKFQDITIGYSHTRPTRQTTHPGTEIT